jgi:glucose-1-phosphate cytidylyltransferase
MKAVILAGGLGSRLSEETAVRPKPMVEIGGRPVLWHIMKIYSSFGINDFIICLGYKGNVIKEYFANYFLYSADVTIDLAKCTSVYHNNVCEPWRVTLVDTGFDTMTGGRLRRVLPFIQDEELFCFTYGDGLANVNIAALIEFHQRQGYPYCGAAKGAVRCAEHERRRNARVSHGEAERRQTMGQWWFPGALPQGRFLS